MPITAIPTIRPQAPIRTVPAAPVGEGVAAVALPDVEAEAPESVPLALAGPL